MPTSEEELRVVLKRIKSAREHAGLSQGQVAKLLSMHRPTISELEAGRRKISVSDLLKLADLYGVSVEWLAGRKPERVGMDDERISIAARDLEKLAPEDLDRILGIIAAVKQSD